MNLGHNPLCLMIYRLGFLCLLFGEFRRRQVTLAEALETRAKKDAEEEVAKRKTGKKGR